MLVQFCVTVWWLMKIDVGAVVWHWQFWCFPFLSLYFSMRDLVSLLQKNIWNCGAVKRTVLLAPTTHWWWGQRMPCRTMCTQPKRSCFCSRLPPYHKSTQTIKTSVATMRAKASRLWIIRMSVPASAQVPHTIRPVGSCFRLHQLSAQNLDQCEFSISALSFFLKCMHVEYRFWSPLSLCRSQMVGDWKEDDSFHSWCAWIQQWCTFWWPYEEKVSGF